MFSAQSTGGPMITQTSATGAPLFPSTIFPLKRVIPSARVGIGVWVADPLGPVALVGPQAASSSTAARQPNAMYWRAESRTMRGRLIVMRTILILAARRRHAVRVLADGTGGQITAIVEELAFSGGDAAFIYEGFAR